MPSADRPRGSRDRDLPLSSIPSATERRGGANERQGFGSYVFGGAALFAAIVAVSFLAAPYIKVPPKSPPGETISAETISAESSLRTAPAVTPTNAAPLTAAPALPQPVTERQAPAPEATRDATLVADLRRDLDAKESSLLSLQATLESEKQARQAAQQELDRIKKDKSVGLSRKEVEAGKKALAESRGEAEAVKRELDEAQKEQARLAAALQAAKVEAERAHAAEARIAALEAKLAESERNAKTRASTFENQADRHQQALKDEGAAVKTLLADLTRTRDELDAERKARRDLERQIGERSSPENPAPASRSVAPSPVAAPPSGRSGSPERTKTVPPQYPDDLRIARIGGRVLLRLLVDELGNVAEVQVASTPHPRLALVAEQAARQWKYNPARHDGLRIKMWLTEAVDFDP